MENNGSESPVNKGEETSGVAKGRRSVILLEGVASCRLLENKGCMTIWEGHWKLLSISGFPGYYDAYLVLSGCRLEIETRLNVSAGAITLEFPELGKKCGIQYLEDVRENMKTLAQLIGDVDATTVSYCLASFKRSNAWEKLLSPNGKAASV